MWSAHVDDGALVARSVGVLNRECIRTLSELVRRAPRCVRVLPRMNDCWGWRKHRIQLIHMPRWLGTTVLKNAHRLDRSIVGDVNYLFPCRLTSSVYTAVDRAVDLVKRSGCFDDSVWTELLYESDWDWDMERVGQFNDRLANTVIYLDSLDNFMMSSSRNAFVQINLHASFANSF